MTQTFNFNPTADPLIDRSRDVAPTTAGQNQTSIILIAQDEPAFCTHIQSLLLDSLLNTPLQFVVAHTGADAVESSLALHPHLVIMDPTLPTYDGLAAARTIWSERPQTKILFWAQRFREIYARDLLTVVPDQAIYGFVLKSSSDEVLVYAVSSILLHDNPYIDPDLRAALRTWQKAGCLSDVEIETLRELALGLTDKAMAMRSSISVRGIQSRINALYRKLLLRDSTVLQKTRAAEMVNLRARLIFEAIRRGLITPEEMSTLDRECFDWIGETLEESR